MKDILKSSANPCPICGRLLWKKWWDNRLNEDGRPLGYNPGRKDAMGRMICWNGRACLNRKEGK